MATAEERSRLRKMLNEPDNTNGWTDERLDEILLLTANLDGSLDFRSAAKSGWEEKAATLTTLVNISENGSSRSSEQEFQHALRMAALFASEPDPLPDASSPPSPGSGRIVRPTRNG